MLTLVLFVILAAGVSYFVAVPLISARVRERVGVASESNHGAGDLVERKESLYAAIKEIEFDYQMGKLSETDFKELRQQYKNDAIGLLKKIDKTESKTGEPKSQQTDQKDAKPESKVNFCWECGEGVSAEDKFCVNCGNALA
ncbi:zinc ribbon domain-containing protein [bacterium]|nr:zinc ribbon domain-containing protein [bacterium]